MRPTTALGGREDRDHLCNSLSTKVPTGAVQEMDILRWICYKIHCGGSVQPGLRKGGTQDRMQQIKGKNEDLRWGRSSEKGQEGKAPKNILKVQLRECNV